MKFEQGLCKSCLYDFKKLLWKDELNPRLRCAFGNVYTALVFDSVEWVGNTLVGAFALTPKLLFRYFLICIA